MAGIGLVTDSTTDMPKEYYEEHGIKVAALYVRFGDEVYREWAEILPDDFYKRMRTATELPKTSQPSVEDFATIYREFEGYDGVISLHISSVLSGTVQSAQIAAEGAPVPVKVIDGKQASLGTGLILKQLIAAREAGKGLDELADMAVELSTKTKILFCVDSLKFLEMGGRIGKAKFLAASLLKIKPILTLVDGEVTPYKSVKGWGKLFKELAAFVSEYPDGRPVNICYAHSDCPERIEQMREAVVATGVEVVGEETSQIGCVIGTYLGPGSFAIVVQPT